MPPYLGWLIAAVSVAACLFLWFRDVRRVMTERRSTMDSAASQLEACRKKWFSTRDDPEAAAVLERSENIYRQAVELYNRTRCQPWNCIPAYLMGFRPVPQNDCNIRREES